MLLIVLGIVILLVIIFVVMYNGFIRLKNNCDEAFATMDVYLKKRYDLIPNLVETVKGYAAHESQTLEKVIAARNMAQNATSPEAKIAGENVLQGTLKSLFALTESYPDLKANQNFMELSSQLQKLEDDISNARRYYNGAVKKYNMSVQTFPRNIIAGMFHFETRPMFEVEDTAQRENVQVKF